jgi:hypothetical protein
VKEGRQELDRKGKEEKSEMERLRNKYDREKNRERL